MFEHRTRISKTSSLVQRALHPVRYLLQSAFDISLAPRALEIFLAVRGVILVEIAFQYTSSNGTRFLVEVTNPLLCCCTRRGKSLVNPT